MNIQDKDSWNLAQVINRGLGSVEITYLIQLNDSFIYIRSESNICNCLRFLFNLCETFWAVCQILLLTEICRNPPSSVWWCFIFLHALLSHLNMPKYHILEHLKSKQILNICSSYIIIIWVSGFVLWESGVSGSSCSAAAVNPPRSCRSVVLFATSVKFY